MLKRIEEVRRAKDGSFMYDGQAILCERETSRIINPSFATVPHDGIDREVLGRHACGNIVTCVATKHCTVCDSFVCDQHFDTDSDMCAHCIDAETEQRHIEPLEFDEDFRV